MKNMFPDGLFLAPKSSMHKIIFGWRSTLDPAGGVYDAPPDSPSWMVWGYPFPFDAFGISMSASTE